MERVLARVGWSVALLAGLLLIAVHSEKVSPMYLHIAAGVAITLGVLGLIFDFKPWRWRIFAGRAKQSWNRVGSLGELAVAWKSSQPDDRHRALGVRYPEWPIIADTAPGVVGFTDWTEEAWNKLDNWLISHGYADDYVLAEYLPRSTVVKALRKGR